MTQALAGSPRDSDITQSAYVYCNGDPVNLTDPSGHGPSDILAGIGGAIVAIGATLLGVAIGAVITGTVVAVGLTVFILAAGVLLIALGVHVLVKAYKDSKHEELAKIKEPKEPHDFLKGGIPGSAGFGITTSFSADPTQILQPLQTPNPRNW